MLSLGWSELEVVYALSLCTGTVHVRKCSQYCWWENLQPVAAQRQGCLLFWIRSAVTLSCQLIKTFKAGGSTNSGDFRAVPS